MVFKGGSFAQAVRDTARLKPAVMSGVLGAAIACSAAFGAMAAESPTLAAPAVTNVDSASANLLQGQLDMARADTQIYVRGLNAIASADLSSLSPKDAVSTLKAMARATLDANPFLGRDNPIEMGRLGTMQTNVRAAADFLGRVSEQPLLTASITQTEAGTLSRRISADHAKAGSDLGVDAFRFEGVTQEMGRSVATKKAVLEEIVKLSAEPDIDVADLVQMALEGKTERAPGERALLQRMVTHALSDATVSNEEKAKAVTGLAMDATADGFLGNVADLWKDQGSSLSAEQVRQVASVGIRTLEGIDGLAANSVPAPAMGR